MKQVVLLPPFDRLWKNKDPFEAAFSLQGEEFRNVKNRRTFRVETEGRGYFVKLHRGVGWKEILKNLFVFKLPVTGAGNEFRVLAALHGAGVPTMQTAAFGERGIDPARLQSFLVTEELCGVISLEDLGNESPAPALRLRMLKALTESVRLMHHAGINHRDCYLCHYLWDGTKLYVIDLHRAQIRKKVPYRYLVKDLSGLEFSAFSAGLTRREALRFIRLYSGKPLRRELTENRRFWCDVEASAKKLFYKEFGKPPADLRPVFPLPANHGDLDHE